MCFHRINHSDDISLSPYFCVCSFWGFGCQEKSLKTVGKQREVQHHCQSTHTRKHPWCQSCLFCFVFYPGAKAGLGDTDRERNFRPHGNVICVSLCQFHIRGSICVATVNLIPQRMFEKKNDTWADSRLLLSK